MSILPSPVLGRKTSCGKSPPVSWSQPVPGEEFTTREHVFEASQRLVIAGLSVIPVDACEGSKGPDSGRLLQALDPISQRPRPSWSVYKIRRPSRTELERWYSVERPYGLAVIGGAVSGGATGLGPEVIDIDTIELARPWMDAVGRKAPGLVNKLVRVQTPRPGLHVYYPCSQFGVSRKLAFAVARDDLGHAPIDVQGVPVRKTLIEVKAEAGYCIVPPSPARAHPSCRLYRYDEGSPDLTAVPTITPIERTILLDAARSLSQCPATRPEKSCSYSRKKSLGVSRPGDDFNARGRWEDILTPHGWTPVGVSGDQIRWCRPGKPAGISATTNHHGSDLLHVFSSNADHFESDRSYCKFSAYTLLNHGGNFKEAARDLRGQGYGTPGLKSGTR
jgi:putative DNA primase/helicase